MRKKKAREASSSETVKESRKGKKKSRDATLVESEARRARGARAKVRGRGERAVSTSASASSFEKIIEKKEKRKTNKSILISLLKI